MSADVNQKIRGPERGKAAWEDGLVHNQDIMREKVVGMSHIGA